MSKIRGPTMNTVLSSLYTIVIVISVFATEAAGDITSLGSSDAGKDVIRQTRQGNFIRIGRGSGFVRIGKMDPERDAKYSDLDDLAKEKSSEFMRTVRQPDIHRFIRIGRNDYTDDGADEEWLASNSKRSSSFVRIGKSNKLDGYDKRASGFVRIGKSFPSDDYEKRASGFVRIGKSYYPDTFDKRGPGFVRIGKRPGFVRIGKDYEKSGLDFIGNDQSMGNKRASGFVRIGKSQKPMDTIAYDKRASGFVRIGKSLLNYDAEDSFKDGGEGVKRGPGFVRIGKSHIGDMLHKRVPGFVRIGKSHFLDNGDEVSRPLFSIKRTVRSTFNDGFDKESAKRASGFVRIGKSNTKDEFDKRTSHFVRIGKNLINAAQHDANLHKKSSGFVRIGKHFLKGKSPLPSSHAPSTSDEWTGDAGQLSPKRPISVSRRGSAFVRIGKIPSAAFVPLGKDIERMMDVPAGRRVGYRRRSRDGQSSFVRIG